MAAQSAGAFGEGGWTEPGLQILWRFSLPGFREACLGLAMARQTRSNDWGFPRWRSYGSQRQAAQVRLCDREGCDLPGEHPAPKSPNRPERWYFCEAHAAEYNR